LLIGFVAVNVILIVGHEKLNVEMQRIYGSRMTVVKSPNRVVYVYTLTCSFLAFIYGPVLSLLTRCWQVVELDVHYRQRVHVQQLHTYFYGQTIAPPPALSITSIGDADFDGHLAPSSSVIPFGELTFLRIGESKKTDVFPPSAVLSNQLIITFLFFPFLIPESMAPSSALPIGATRTVNEMQPITLDPASPGSGLLNAIVALLALPMHPEETERYDEEVLDLPVSGFLAMFVSIISFFSPS